jgi:copper oxidase (laccase) domain-containing protein
LAKRPYLRYLCRVTEAFPFLKTICAVPGVRAGWVERIPDLAILGGRDEAMQVLRPAHTAAVAAFSHPGSRWVRAEQVHGTAVAVVPGAAEILAPDGLPVVPGVDGLITNEPGIVLVIYVADCGAIWLADRATGAIGLLHSGKKGTNGNILAVALATMAENFGTRPEDVSAVLSPCIRVPEYDVDFAGEISRQARQVGIGSFVDSGLNTATDLQRFYSYRRELGVTGRMMALLTRDPS